MILNHLWVRRWAKWQKYCYWPLVIFIQTIYSFMLKLLSLDKHIMSKWIGLVSITMVTVWYPKPEYQKLYPYTNWPLFLLVNICYLPFGSNFMFPITLIDQFSYKVMKVYLKPINWLDHSRIMHYRIKWTKFDIIVEGTLTYT